MLTECSRTTEKQLVQKCQKGDSESFRQIYRRYHRRVRSTLYQLCGDRFLDDLVQEVFLRVWKGLPKLREASYFSTWLYRITWNVATDQRKKFAKSQRERENYEEKEEFSSENQDLMEIHYQDLVKRGLKNLSLEHRAVLVLHDLEDIPQKEVAKILNVPLGTVKSRLFHARNSLRKFLKQEGISL